MNESKLKNLVDEAVVLDRQKAEIESRLKKIKAALVIEAEARPEDQVPTEGGGSSIRFTGADGCCATVSFPARTLRTSISAESKLFLKVFEAAGDTPFGRLFETVSVYRPIDNFRAEAEIILGKDARRLIKLCESETSPRVSFETKDSTEAKS